jgi:hypothetical protein
MSPPVSRCTPWLGAIAPVTTEPTAAMTRAPTTRVAARSATTRQRAIGWAISISNFPPASSLAQCEVWVIA